LDDALGDRQPQPGPALGPAAGLVDTVEAVEDARQMLRRDADARVTYDGHGRPVPPADAGLDLSGPGRVLDGVVEQVEEHLAESTRSATDEDRPVLDNA